MSALHIRPLNSELQLIAKKELYENTDQIQENLDILREWLKKSTHLTARSSDQFLIPFLRGCKYSLERTKQKIDMYYTYRTQIPELIGDRDPLNDKINEVIKLGVTLPLPITESPGSPRIIFYRVGVINPNQIRIEDVMRVSMMINDILMNEDDNTVVSGQINIVDVTNFSMGHLIQLQPVFLKKLLMIWQESSPIRQKGIHYINAPKIFEQFFNLIKSLMNEKMKERLFIHSSLESLYSVIPRKIMPIEYDGEAGSIQGLVDDWETKILSYRDYFLDESQHFGVDEKKRTGSAKNALFGIDGSFRRLQFD